MDPCYNLLLMQKPQFALLLPHFETLTGTYSKGEIEKYKKINSRVTSSIKLLGGFMNECILRVVHILTT